MTEELTKKQHDALVLLAEDVPWWSVCEALGYPQTIASMELLYLLMQKLEVPPTGRFEDNVVNLVAEAKRRMYQDDIYMLHYDDVQMEIDELGAPLPRYVPVNPRKE